MQDETGHALFAFTSVQDACCDTEEVELLTFLEGLRRVESVVAALMLLEIEGLLACYSLNM